MMEQATPLSPPQTWWPPRWPTTPSEPPGTARPPHRRSSVWSMWTCPDAHNRYEWTTTMGYLLVVFTCCMHIYLEHSGKCSAVCKSLLLLGPGSVCPCPLTHCGCCWGKGKPPLSLPTRASHCAVYSFAEGSAWVQKQGKAFKAVNADHNLESK